MQGKDYRGAQEPIITKKLFYDVQRKLKRDKYGDSRHNKHNPIFKGMILCEPCGGKISWSKQKGRYYGSCQRREEECKSARFLREDRVEALVIAKLEEIADPKGKVLGKLKAALQIVQPQDVGMYRQKMIEELGRQVQKLHKMDVNLYDDRLAGFISKEKYEQKRQQLAREAADVAERLAMLREAQDMPKQEAQKPESDCPIVDLYLKSLPSQKRIIMATLLKPIVAQGNKGVIVSLYGYPRAG